MFTEYPFHVKLFNPGLDCEIKVRFHEKHDNETKANFISEVMKTVDTFNKANEVGEESKGLIHYVS